MEFFKDIAAILGVILSSASVFTLICKPIRRRFIAAVQQNSGKSETENQLHAIEQLLKAHMEEDRRFAEEMKRSMGITLNFTEKQCRNLIKNIFYQYCDEKTLPLYEKKVLMDIEELYIKQMHKNHYGQLLIEQMKTWDIDYSRGGAEEGPAE